MADQKAAGWADQRGSDWAGCWVVLMVVERVGQRAASMAVYLVG